MSRDYFRRREASSFNLAFYHTKCYIILQVVESHAPMRTFKTAWFSKVARKALIKDSELCEAIDEAIKGQADDLGGGVFKKRLSKNSHRSIILSKGGTNWVYTYLYAKKDRANIDEKELIEFRKLAKIYANLTQHQIQLLLTNNEFTEICYGNKAEI
jgi:hypothetical protein